MARNGAQRPIISLTTIPSRLEAIKPTLDALIAQNIDDKEICLFIPESYARFPDFDGKIPSYPKGVTVLRPKHDYGPASKLLHALKREDIDPDTPIFYCDDDQLYPENSLSELLKTGTQKPDDAIAVAGFNWHNHYKQSVFNEHLPRYGRSPFAPPKPLQLGYAYRRLIWSLSGKPSAKPKRNTYRRSGYADIAEGFAGVLVRPRFFTKRIFDIPNEARFVDDIWISANLTKNGHGIWIEAQLRKRFPTSFDAIDGLNISEFDGKKRRDLDLAALAYCQEHLGIWQES